jgi:hypothetical protein
MKARMDAVQVEAMLEPAVGLPRRDRQQPAVRLQRIEQLEHAVEQRLLDPARRAQAMKLRLYASASSTCSGERHPAPARRSPPPG